MCRKSKVAIKSLQPQFYSALISFLMSVGFVTGSSLEQESGSYESALVVVLLRRKLLILVGNCLYRMLDSLN